jgi:hypothetical protein
MKTTNKKYWVLVLILPLLLVGTAASAATTENFRLKGTTVTARFTAPDSNDPCLEFFVFVSAADLVEKVTSSGQTAATRTVLEAIQFDACAEVIIQDFGGDTMDQTLRVASDLSSATLTATVPVLDIISQTGSIFQVNLIFTATGPAQTTQLKETFVDKDLGIKIKTISRSTVAEASATGTVVEGGQNWTPGPSDTATIQKQNDGSLAIQK